ncbi:hypothetical protein GJAV_G00249040 [Gymnothorax javanicus]|nr:hypothetical protein GJAV_G00249040 [Gymnothorax javanicus]
MHFEKKRGFPSRYQGSASKKTISILLTVGNCNDCSSNHCKPNDRRCSNNNYSPNHHKCSNYSYSPYDYKLSNSNSKCSTNNCDPNNYQCSNNTCSPFYNKCAKNNSSSNNHKNSNNDCSCYGHKRSNNCCRNNNSVPPITAAPTIEPATTISPKETGPVFIFPRLVFHTNNTVPSESEVLSQANPLLNGDEILLNDTVRVQNLTYERLTNNSFALTLGYKMNDVSFPENVDLRSETEDRIQDSVNVLMNGLLNQRTANPFTFPQANYIHMPDEIQANVEYTYQAADISQPSGFLNAILTASGASSKTAPPTNSPTPVVPATQTPTVTGPVFIFPRLVFHTNNTVPSESEVLSRATPFLNGDEILLNDTVRVQNLTYKRLTNNSFALTLGYKMNDVSFPENVDLRSETEDRIQDSVNVLMSGLLNQPTANPFTFPQANYIHMPDEIQANVEYTYQAADISQPSGFLNAILTASGASSTTAPPTNSPTPVVPATQTPTVTGPVFIFPRLVFHTNNTVPSESEVLSRATPFLNGDEIQLNDTVRVQNLTYERLTNNSFALTLGYKMNDVSFPENVDLRSETEDRIQDSVNVLMNGLLNQPTANPFTFPQANYIHMPDEIQANVEYTYQAADISQPSGFLNAILTASGASSTTAPPTNSPTPVVPATQTPTVTGPVFIFPRLVFHTNNTVPSESEVLSRATPFLNGDEILLNDTVRVQNLTYERLTNNSFALTLGYKMNDVSFPENVDLRSETEDRIQDSVNVLMNGLLNQPTANPFTFPQANYIHMPDEIQANVEYTYQAADISQPSGFLNAILTASGASSTTAPPTNSPTPVVPATQTPTVTGPVFIFPRLVFHTNNTVPSESEVLSRATPFLNGDEILLNDTMNGLLNQPTANPFTFPQANYIHMPDEIQANVEYTYQAADISQPSGLLNAILTASGASSTTAPPTNSPTPVVPATQTPTVTGPVFIFPRLVFHTNNTVPSESEVLSRATPFLNGDEILLNDTVRVQNLTYERLTNNSFALTLGYKMNDVSFPENVDLRSETEDRIQDSVNVLMNGLLNQPTANPFTFPQANYIHMPDEIQANVEYTYQAADISQPSGFLNAILTASGASSTTAPSTNSPTPVVPTTQTPTVVGTVFIIVRFVFTTIQPAPSENEVLSQANLFLNRHPRELNTPISVSNLTYERLTDNSFALRLRYKINNVTFAKNAALRADTEQLIQNEINTLLNRLLNQPDANPFTFPEGTHNHTNNEIHTEVNYRFSEGDITQPSSFLSAILKVSGLLTTAAPTTTSTTNSTNPAVLLITKGSGSVAWILGFIIPVGIVIILLPFWIILCCVLFGGFAAIKKRWRRRQAYHLQQYVVHPMSSRP